jgi:hypothetical protein
MFIVNKICIKGLDSSSGIPAGILSMVVVKRF